LQHVSAPVRLIVNPSAGGGRAASVAPVAEGALRRLGVSVERFDTRDLDHARELAREGANAGEVVVALSGDGMVGAIADCLKDLPGAVMGVIPGGRGNDLARVLGIPDQPDQAAAVIAAGHARAIDLGLVLDGSGEPRAFVGIASVGFDSEANRIANEAPSWLGNLVYLYGALRALLAWKPARFELELDPPGEKIGVTAYTVGAANSQCYGGGMRAAPEALLDDGMLEVIVLESVSKIAFLTRIIPKVFKGEHVHEPGVSGFRAREVAISCERPFEMYADGDPIGSLPLRVSALHGAVRMLVPAAGGPHPVFAQPPPAGTEQGVPEGR
jgi:YegS/Rv2252/BmrU family lipid kinase